MKTQPHLHSRWKGKELTTAQFAMLRQIRRGKGPFSHLRGMHEHGGGALTLASLLKHQLAESQPGGAITITERGKAALKTGRIL